MFVSNATVLINWSLTVTLTTGHWGARQIPREAAASCFPLKPPLHRPTGRGRLNHTLFLLRCHMFLQLTVTAVFFTNACSVVDDDIKTAVVRSVAAL